MTSLRFIDFTGYYYNDKFVIKEISRCKVSSNNHYRRPILLITKPPSENISDENFESYQQYYNEYGIEWNTGFFEIDRLRHGLNDMINNSQYFYVKNSIKAQQLMNFLDLPGMHDNIKMLDDIGFNENSLLTNGCRYHNNQRFNYCARDNVIEMTFWFLRMQTISYIVIDFSGYYLSNNKFILKELSINGLDIGGSTAYQNLFVIFPPTELSNSSDVIDEYNRNYFNKYGIEWTKGSYELSYIRMLLNNFIKISTSNIIYVFVKNEIYKNILIRIIGNSHDILCLNKFNYNERELLSTTNCSYHTHEDVNKNICAGDNVERMVDWIVEKEYYKIEKILAKLAINKILQQSRYLNKTKY